jgi:membrane-associated phospholipid phosphatase
MSPQTGRPTVEDVLARPIESRRGEGSRWARALRELGAVDRAVFDAVFRTPTAELDGPVRGLSQSANGSALWLGIGAAIALTGGRRGRRAAFEGVVSVAVTAAAVNLGAKSVVERRRPDRGGLRLLAARHLRTPESTSFPSGHAATSFAFAYGVSRHIPLLALPLGLLAGAVAYSRVHTGVHYPGDVAVGSIAGAGTAAMVAAVFDRLRTADQRFVSNRQSVRG